MCLSIAVKFPERVLSKGEHLGLEWVTVHNGAGSRCGYVRVPPGHPWHGFQMNQTYDIEVHGGVTFAEPDEHCGKGGPDDAWWLGFDCAHYGDMPDLSLYPKACTYFRGTVRDQEYVESECKKLCEQVKEAEHATSI